MHAPPSSTLERLNRNVKPALDDLTQTTDFFSHYRVNLFHKKCPFWNDENGMCGNIACAVETLDNEEDIPLVWRASELGKLEGPHARHPGKSMQKEEPRRPLQGGLGENVGESCVVEYDDECDDRDYCVPEDERGLQGGLRELVAQPGALHWLRRRRREAGLGRHLPGELFPAELVSTLGSARRRPIRQRDLRPWISRP